MQFTYQQGGIAWLFLLQLSHTPQVSRQVPASCLVPTRYVHRYTYVSADVVLPTAPYLTLGDKHADRQTFQVLKTWKV